MTIVLCLLSRPTLGLDPTATERATATRAKQQRESSFSPIYTANSVSSSLRKGSASKDQEEEEEEEEELFDFVKNDDIPLDDQQQQQQQEEQEQRELSDCTALTNMKEVETEAYTVTSLNDLADPIDGIMFRTSRLVILDPNDNTTTFSEQALATDVVLRGMILRLAWQGTSSASAANPPRVQVYTTRADFNHNETVDQGPAAWTLLADAPLVFPKIHGLPTAGDLASAHGNAWALLPAHSFAPISIEPGQHRSFYIRILQNANAPGLTAQLTNTATAFLALDDVGLEGPHFNVHTGNPTYENPASNGNDWGEMQQAYAPPLLGVQFHYQLQEPLIFGTDATTIESCEEAQSLAQANRESPWTTFTMDYEHLIATNAVDRWKPTLEQTEQLHGTVANRITGILQSDGYLRTYYTSNRISVSAVTSELRGCLGRPNLEMTACQSLLYTITFSFRGTPLQAHHIQSQLYGYTNYGIADTVSDGVKRLGGGSSNTYNIGYERVQAPFSLQLTTAASAQSTPLDVLQMQFLEQAVLNFVNLRLNENKTALILRWELSSSTVAAAEVGSDKTVYTFGGTLYGAQIAQQRLEGALNHYAEIVQQVLDTGDLNALRNELQYASQLPDQVDTLMAIDVQPARYVLFTQVENVNVTMGLTDGVFVATEPEDYLEVIIASMIAIVVLAIATAIGIWRFTKYEEKLAAERKAEREALQAANPRQSKKMADYYDSDDEEFDDEMTHDSEDDKFRSSTTPRTPQGRTPPAATGFIGREYAGY